MIAGRVGVLLRYPVKSMAGRIAAVFEARIDEIFRPADEPANAPPG